MKFDVLTLFPDLIYSYTDESILGRAQSVRANGRSPLLTIKAHNFRQFSGNKWGHVDDKPYGGGPGMVLRVEPIYECLKAIGALSLRGTRRSEARSNLMVSKTKSVLKSKGLLRFARNDKTKVIVMDPAGKKFDQRMAEKFSKLDRLVLIAGRYEGFDARVYGLADERISVGDFVLAGGELPALTIIEAVSRLIPGVLGNPDSLISETHNVERVTKDKLPPGSTLRVTRSTREHPQYTKPVDFMGKKVPKVLMSGNHKLIEEWRKNKSK